VSTGSLGGDLDRELQDAIWSHLAKEGDAVPGVEVRLESDEGGKLSGEIFLAFPFLRHNARADLTRASERLREGFDADAVLSGRFKSVELKEQEFFTRRFRIKDAS
jgi:hypothetical protein